MPTLISPDDQIITELVAAALCGFSRDTLRRYVKAGDGPPRIRLSTHRIGYRLRDLRTWIDGRVIEEARS
jgi:predicted DNA-binding transcriptional regulator AlpA